MQEKRLLLISMEYTQEEINEPINIDIILQSVPKELFSESQITRIYRDLDKDIKCDLDEYDIILVSTKITSLDRLKAILTNYSRPIVIIGGILAICEYDKLSPLFPDAVFLTGESESNVESVLRIAYSATSSNDVKKELINRKISNVAFLYSDGVYDSKREVCNLENQVNPSHTVLKEVMDKNGLVRMETSRGCPWNKCSFCIMPWKFCGENWRSFSKSKMEKELQLLISEGVKQIYFTDEDFVGNYSHINDLCDIIERCVTDNQSLVFGGSTSVYTLNGLGEKLQTCLHRMRQVGIKRLFVGIESGSDSQLLRYQKGVTSEMNKRMIKMLQEYDFDIDYGFILFDAKTTMEELYENLNFIEQTGLRNEISRFTKKLRLTPHTRLYEEYRIENRIISDLNENELTYEYDFIDPRIKMISRCAEQLDGISLPEANRLQAMVRASTSIEERKQVKTKLLTIRELSFAFLKQCVEKYYSDSKFSENDVLEIFAEVKNKKEGL